MSQIKEVQDEKALVSQKIEETDMKEGKRKERILAEITENGGIQKEEEGSQLIDETIQLANEIKGQQDKDVDKSIGLVTSERSLEIDEQKQKPSKINDESWKEKMRQANLKIIGLVKQDDLRNVLIESVRQIESITDLAASLGVKFSQISDIAELLNSVQQTKELWLDQISELCDILIQDNFQSNIDKIPLKNQNEENFNQQEIQQYPQPQSIAEILQAKDNPEENAFHSFINLKMVQLLANYFSENILKDLESSYQRLAKISLEPQHNDIRQHAVNDAIIAHRKIMHTIQIFPHAAISDKADLFSLHPEDDKWKKLKEKVLVKQINHPKKMEASLQKVVRGCVLGHAVISSGDLQQNKLKKQICLNLGTIYYFLQPQKSLKQAKYSFSNPSTINAVKVLNIMDTGLLKYFMQITFPSVKYHQRIQIDPVVSRITLESILKEYSNPNFFKAEVDQEKKDQNTQDIQKARILICGKDGKDENEYYKKLFVKEQIDHSKISIRILCSKPLVRPTLGKGFENGAVVAGEDMSDIKTTSDEKQPEGLFTKIKNVFNFSGRGQQFFEEIIIHIHGGGFVGMSSRCSQVYSRLWANELNLPIFSIDYRKAPEFPYPAALDDVWQSYNWILNFVSRFFNIKPKKIILIGDSAGGNLSIGLTFRCIQTGIRVPDGIVMAYPSLNLNPKAFTPSFLIALNDPIISMEFLKICLESYIPENSGVRPDIDPFISPSYASDDLLRQLPPIRILIGTIDPLHDECWRFFQRLQSLKNDVKMNVYNGMPHGFLNYVGPLDMKEAYVCVKDSADFIKELLAQ